MIKIGFDLDADFATSLCSLDKADEVIQQLNSCLTRVKRHRNTLLPIARLPQDVLAEIFSQLVRTHDLRGTAKFRGAEDYPHRWIYATHVCHTWRALCLSCSNLWTRVILSHPERTQAFLQRSRGCPIALEAKIGIFWMTPEADMILDNSHRLCLIDNLKTSRSLVDTLGCAQSNGLHLPLLEYLRARSYAVPDFPALSAAYMPRLRQLHCICFSFTLMRSCLRPTVKELHFRKGGRTPLTDWLDLLSSMPQLERLFIQNAMVPLDIPLDGTRPPQRRIDLPNLQWLKLEELDNEKFTPYAYLLAHMSYPSDTYISLKSSDYRQSWLADYTFVVSHAAPCRSTVMTGQQEFSSAKLLIEPNVRPNNLRLRFSATRMAASNKDTPEEAIVLDFTVPASAVAQTNTELYKHLRSLSLPFGVTELQVAELPASSDSWFGTMREADILDSVITLQVSAKELSALVSALEDSTQNGAAASLLPRWQFLRLTRCKSREFGTRASEKPARERLLAALAIRRKQDLGPSSVFLGVKKEEVDDVLSKAGFTEHPRVSAQLQEGLSGGASLGI